MTAAPEVDPGPDSWGTVYDDRVYFATVYPDGLSRLYVSDGTNAGTRVLATGSEQGDALAVAGMSGGWVYYTRSLNEGGAELDRTDGRVTQTLYNDTGVDLQALTATQSVFVTGGVGGQRLAVTDGSAAGTHSVETDATYVSGLGVLNGVAYFFGHAADGSAGVFRTDGTRAGTYRLLAPGDGNYTRGAEDAVTFAGRLYLHTSGTGGAVYAVAADGSVQTVRADGGDAPLVVDGSRLWVSGVTAYVTAAAPTTVVPTDARVYGTAAAAAGGRYVYLADPYSFGSAPLYAWDSASPPVGDVRGIVYNDLDGDGVRQGAEPALGNVRVYADLNGNGAYDAGTDAVTTANAGGGYNLLSVPVGTYTIGVVPVAGQVAASAAASALVTPGGQAAVDVLASPGARLIGTVFNDVNGNGVRDAGEPGLANVTVFVDASSTATTAAAGDLAAVTDANGRYVLANAGGVSGYLRVQSPGSGYTVAQPAYSTASIPAGTVGVVAGPTVAVSGSGGVRVAFGVDTDGDGAVTSADAGVNSPTLPVYVDLNRNGQYDSGEPRGLLSNGGVLGNVPMGSRLVRVIPPQGWATSLAGNAAEVTVTPNTTVAVPAFTLVPRGDVAAVVGGRLGGDTDFSGSITAADPPVPLALLWDDANADGVRGAAEAYTYATASGAYAFTDLSAGPHRIAFAGGGYLPAGGTPTYFTADPTAGAVVRDLPLYGAKQQVRVGGRAWFDANGNGVLDAADTPLAGASVVVSSNSGVALVASTDSAGGFSVLTTSGTFRPYVGYLPSYYSGLTSPTSKTLGTGQAFDDFALLVRGPSPALGSVSGVVFNDANLNGRRDPGETPQAGVTVWADVDSDRIRTGNDPSVVTAADGSYTLGGLAPTTIEVNVVAPAGKGVTNAGSGRISVTPGSAASAATDFGLADAAPVRGTAFVDYDGNGAPGTFDRLLANQFVWADLNDDGVIQDNEQTALTDYNGNYTLANVPAGVAAVVRTSPNERGLTGTIAVNVTAGAPGLTRTVQFPLTNGLAVVAGRIYFDGNGNGVYDSAETLGTSAITLRDPSGNALATAKTDSAGYWRFFDVKPGTYRLTAEFDPTASAYTLLQGKDGVSVSVAAGQVSSGTLFSTYYKPITYVGNAYLDAARNGTLTPVVGTRAYLDANYNGVYDAGEYFALTDSAGHYAIKDVPYKDYYDASQFPLKVTVENPSRTLMIDPYPFTQPLYTMYDYTTAVATVSAVTFAPPTGTYASGYLYLDLNTNGVRDPGEPGIVGKQVGSSFTSPDFNAVLTDHDGYYVWLPPNSPAYPATLSTNLPATWISTDGSGGKRRVTFAGTNPMADFGFVNFQIGGSLFDDANGNGVRDTDETAVAGRTVYLDTNKNGALDAGETSTTSDATGFFSFTGLGSGTFRVAQVLPTGATGQTTDVTLAAGKAKGGLSLGSRAAPTTVTAVAIDDGSGQRSRVRSVMLTLNGTIAAGRIAAGAFTLAQTSGTIGTYGVTVASVTAAGGQTQIVLTFTGAGLTAGALADGRYTLLVDGSKILDSTGRAIDAAGTAVAGSTRGVSFFALFGDGDGNGTVNIYDYLQFQTTYNTQSPSTAYLAGFDGDGVINIYDYLQFQTEYGHSIDTLVTTPLPTPTPMPTPVPSSAATNTASITGTAFNDANANGVPDRGEVAGKGTVVYLDANNNGVLDKAELRTTTDAAGRFTFAKLAAGTYRVRRVATKGSTAAPTVVTLAKGQARRSLAVSQRPLPTKAAAPPQAQAPRTH